DDDIGGKSKLSCRSPAAVGLEVERNALLVTVHRTERAIVVGLSPHPERIAAIGRLDLDHLGAEIRQQHASEWPADITRKLQDPDSIQRARDRGHQQCSTPVPIVIANNADLTTRRA